MHPKETLQSEPETNSQPGLLFLRTLGGTSARALTAITMAAFRRNRYQLHHNQCSSDKADLMSSVWPVVYL
jgi:hypothetical protein